MRSPLQQQRRTPSRTLFLFLLIFSVVGQSAGAGSHSAALAQVSSPGSFAQAEFRRVWSRTDQPVAAGAVARSWIWGPAPGVSLQEQFAEGVDGKRAVQYFDKARMELNPSVSDARSPWRVSTGLLVSEMAQGRVQVGEKQFLPAQPSTEAVVGDSGASVNPRYSDFTPLLVGKSTDRTGSEVVDALGPGGKVSTVSPAQVRYARFITETVRNIPDVFWDYMNQDGPVSDEQGKPSTERVFDWLYVMGYPITEAYWVRALIAGKERMVLVQLFQRRAISYVPDFPEGWRVQMGNVGQHYYGWRYKGAGVVEPGAPPPSPLRPTGKFVGISGDSFIYAGEEIKLKGTNYWLHSQPFIGTWAEWDGPQALAELGKAKELGVNTVRIGIPFDHFVTRDVVWDNDKTFSKVSDWIINQMTQLLQIAGTYDMKVIFTLFEWYDYYPAEGSADERANLTYIEGIVGAFANDDRVLGWDLHNEPDFYGEWLGGKQSDGIKWLQRMARAVRRYDQRHPITVGVGDYKSLWYPAKDGTTIMSFVDFVSFHSYDAGALPKQIAEVKARTSKPVLLEEMGWPTSPGAVPAPPGAVFDEATQNYLYTTMLKASKEGDIAGVMQWTLWDYRHRSTVREDQLPNYEEHFGLVRTDGTFKPAADIFKNDYTGRALPSDTRTWEPLTPAGKRNKKP